MRVSALPDLTTRSAVAAGTAVLVLLVTAVTGLITVGGPASGASGARVPGYPPTAHGLVLQRLTDAGFDTAVRDARDPRRIYVMVPHDDAATACSVIQPVVTVLAQTRTAVRIRVSGYEYLPAPNKDGYVGFSCYLGGSVGVGVRLTAALGTRAVLSAPHLLHSGTDAAAAVIDPRDFPRPRHLPAGYRAESARPIDALHGIVVAERRYARGSATLVISSGPTADVDPTPGRRGTPTVVNKLSARVVTDSGVRCVLWRRPTGNGRAVCSFAATPLSAAALVRIARTLR
jgi:hypothetical protein